MSPLLVDSEETLHSSYALRSQRTLPGRTLQLVPPSNSNEDVSLSGAAYSVNKHLIGSWNCYDKWNNVVYSHDYMITYLFEVILEIVHFTLYRAGTAIFAATTQYARGIRLSYCALFPLTGAVFLDGFDISFI